ncbi:hypothetical protein N7478_001441 [Penicillium angulare]|uniref:uncharacterized protein n=1 Tax=Penicillium angulare TaxID=116970 RepID=UPI002540AE44|nr:uncharacterized protein N7478_001441 [Penicillium angulare]KAJ5292190.1 hypothetical protein N7478_001441 [Penicillium angulare]
MSDAAHHRWRILVSSNRGYAREHSHVRSSTFKVAVLLLGLAVTILNVKVFPQSFHQYYFICILTFQRSCVRKDARHPRAVPHQLEPASRVERQRFDAIVSFLRAKPVSGVVKMVSVPTQQMCTRAHLASRAVSPNNDAVLNHARARAFLEECPKRLAFVKQAAEAYKRHRLGWHRQIKTNRSVARSMRQLELG